MTKKFWLKSAALLATGAYVAIGFSGCLGAAIQRILVAVNFD
jgi:hypothetical protein